MGVGQALAVAAAVRHVLQALPLVGDVIVENSQVALPWKQLQRQLQRLMQGLSIVAIATTVTSLLLFWILPGIPFTFPGFIAFTLGVNTLWMTCIAQLLLRYVLVPFPRSFLPDHKSIPGTFQTLLCAFTDVVGRMKQDAPIIIVFLTTLVHAWVWKLTLATVFASYSVPVDAAAIATSAIVSFIYFMFVDPHLGSDPFILDPRSALVANIQRAIVQAARRGVITGFTIHFSLVFFSSHPVGLFSFSSSFCWFHICGATIEAFVTLSSASVFRMLLFQIAYPAVQSSMSDNSLWRSLSATSTESRQIIIGSDKAHLTGKPEDLAVGSVEDLFASSLAISTSDGKPLNEQYNESSEKRKEEAKARIASRSVSGSSYLSLDALDALNDTFKFEYLRKACRFDPSARAYLLSSQDNWQRFYESTTGVIDSFTLSLQLLSGLPSRRGEPVAAEAEGLDKSSRALLQFVSERSDRHPLLVLGQYPSLSNLSVPASAFTYRIHYMIESYIQYAIRRFLMEQARHRIFLRTKAVYTAQALLADVICVSREEDTLGLVQHAVPAAVTSLVECRAALKEFIQMSTQLGDPEDIYVEKANALVCGIDKDIYRITTTYHKELSAFNFSLPVEKDLAAYKNELVS